ncbi:MAG: LolA family protein [Planctomycetota bacterium]
MARVSYDWPQPMRPLAMTCKLSIIILASSMLRCAAPPPADPPPPETQPADAPEASVELTAEDLLLLLERSADDLRDFKAQLTYYKWDELLQQKQIRTGELIYQVRPDGSKRFAILFDRLYVGSRARDHRKHYIFDGSWLVEVDHENKQFIKRQIVPPGRRFDPLKLGEGPFPLPIGQPRDEVLKLFEAGLAEVPADEPLSKLSGVYGLVLTPKPGTPEAKDLARAELFYDREMLLPRGINVVETNDDTKTVLLRDLKRNAGVDESLLDTSEPDPKEWQIDIRPWREGP